MTKRIITILLAFTLVFAIGSCSKPKGDSQKNKEIDFTKIDKIEVSYSSRHFDLTDEQMAYVISLWEKGQWEPGEYKTHRPYQFEAGDLVLTYHLEGGQFYDETNDRTLFISDEQIEVLRLYITTVSADAIAQITVGMTLQQVAQILMAPGKGVESEESDGQIIAVYQFYCEDGSKYHITFLVDDEHKLPTVTDITKVKAESSPEA